MHKKKILFSLRKELLDYLHNPISLLLLVLTSFFLLFADKLSFFQEASKEMKPEKFYIILDFVFCVFLISQYIYDSFKRDCFTGSIIFYLNTKSPCKIYLFGKTFVSLIITFIILFLKFPFLVSLFSSFDYLWIFLFFIFVITNSIFFSMLFYTPNTNSLAYLFLFIVPVILILIFLSFRLPIIKSIILLCFILSLTKNIRKLWFSKRFRLYLK